MRRRSIVALLATLMVMTMTVGASAAFAGERAGTGDETAAPDNARSSCAFSGLEDNDFEQPVEPGVTQSWGQIVQSVGPVGGLLGGADGPHFDPDNNVVGCNAHLYPHIGG
jgi:hypothetical protein